MVDLCVGQDLLEVLEDADFTPTREPSRLHDPHVIVTIKFCLGIALFQLIDQRFTNLVDILAHGFLLLVGGQIFVLLELRKALECLAVPFFVTNVLEVGDRKLLLAAKKERSLLHRDLTRRYPVRHDALLLVQFVIDWLQSIAHNVTANQELLLEEAKVLQSARKIGDSDIGRLLENSDSVWLSTVGQGRFLDRGGFMQR